MRANEAELLTALKSKQKAITMMEALQMCAQYRLYELMEKDLKENGIEKD